MVWRIPTSITGVIDVISLGATDSVFVAAGVLVAATNQRAIIGTGADQTILIEGTVAAPQSTIDARDGILVEVRAAGLVQGLGSMSIGLSGNGTTLVNHGRILQTGNHAIMNSSDQAGDNVAVINHGLIEASQTAIESFYSTGAFRLDNHGTIRAGTFAYYDEPGSLPGATDSIFNSGTIVGDIELGRADDLFDGRSGVLDGDLFGGAGNDRLYTGAGVNRVFGGAGTDTLMGGAGGDYLSGGTGLDTASYAAATAGVTASLINPSINTGDAAGDSYNSVENLTGSGFGDNLSGTHGSNRIVAGAGDDYLRGYLGNDTLFGQAGRDTFIFNTALNGTTNVDRIADFLSADDTFWLDDLVFVGIGAPGALAAGAFRANTSGTAGDATDRIIYDTDGGQLYFDADGNGAGARVLFAVLLPGLAIAAADFTVI